MQRPPPHSSAAARLDLKSPSWPLELRLCSCGSSRTHKRRRHISLQPPFRNCCYLVLVRCGPTPSASSLLVCYLLARIEGADWKLRHNTTSANECPASAALPCGPPSGLSDYTLGQGQARGCLSSCIFTLSEHSAAARRRLVKDVVEEDLTTTAPAAPLGLPPPSLICSQAC